MTLLIMLDPIKRLFGMNTRPIDEWMFVIELLVLILIFVDITARGIVWFKHWLEHRKFERRVLAWLASLSPSDIYFMKNLVLLRHEPLSEVGLSLRKAMPTLFENDYKGTCIVPEHKKLLQEWAQRATTDWTP